MTDGTDAGHQGPRNVVDASDEPLKRYRLIGIDELSQITGLSKATLWRHHTNGLIPHGCTIGRSVRWRLRTGNPQTGILDWLDVGCPPCNSHQKGLEA